MADALRIWKWPLHWQILLGLALGAVAGWALGAWAVAQIPADTPAAKNGVVASAIARDSSLFMVLKLLADLFMNGLKLIVVPLVTSSIILAIANIGHGRDFGRLGLKTMAYYIVTSFIAIMIGLTLVNVVRPGFGSDGKGILQQRDLSAFEGDQAEVNKRTEGKDAGDFLDVFRQMVPPNLIESARNNDLLGLIVVSMLVGFFISRLKADSQPVLLRFTQGVYDVTLKITGVVLALAPIGVLGLLAVTVSEQYAKLVPDGRFAEFAGGIGKFALVALFGLLFHLLISMPLILALLGRVNPLRHYRAMAPAMATAFSCSSSSATLPVTMGCVENRAGVSNKVTGFVLPLGATVNMDGTALYECACAMFVAQAFGLELSFATQFMIVIMALLTSIGVAGVPSASLVAIVVILQAVERQLPPGALPPGTSLVMGMGLIFVFDRPLDMLRTVVNIFSDSVGAVVVARSEGERNVLAPPAAETAMAE